MCGFNELTRDEKVNRANEILNSAELKQAICHRILGTTFRDVERVMESILSERRLTQAQEEELELREMSPEKFEPEFDADFEFKMHEEAADSKKSRGYTTYSKHEVAKLMAASNAEFKPRVPEEPKDYHTYSFAQVQELMHEHYEHLERQKKRKQEREEKEKWDSQKTTESEPKTKQKTKRTKSTKV